MDFHLLLVQYIMLTQCVCTFYCKCLTKCKYSAVNVSLNVNALLKMFHVQVYLTVKFNKQTTTTLSPKETVCEQTSWESATGSSGFADATEKARGKDSLPDSMQCQCERSKDKVSTIHECTHASVDNPYISKVVFGLCSDSRMFSAIDPSFLINLSRLKFIHARSQQAVWEQKNIRPGSEACSGTCSSLFSHDHVLCHCTLCQMRSGHYLYGNMTQQAKDIAQTLYRLLNTYILIRSQCIANINGQFMVNRTL